MDNYIKFYGNDLMSAWRNSWESFGQYIGSDGDRKPNYHTLLIYYDIVNMINNGKEYFKGDEAIAEQFNMGRSTVGRCIHQLKILNKIECVYSRDRFSNKKKRIIKLKDGTESISGFWFPVYYGRAELEDILLQFFVHTCKYNGECLATTRQLREMFGVSKTKLATILESMENRKLILRENDDTGRMIKVHVL